MNSEINCKEVMKHVCETLGEDLNSERCRSIKKHLEECSDCQNYFKSVERTIDFYRDYKITMPAEAHNRLMSTLGLNEENNK